MRGCHIHEYCTNTTIDAGHDHLMMGKTSYDPDTPGHVHRYKGKTSCVKGHTHCYRGVTGPAIPLPCGGHTHEIAGITDCSHGHRHRFYTETRT